MSYRIIFETKIIKLSDGRLLHLSLEGCNNDTSGRNRGDFIGKIYTKEDFVKYAENFKKDSIPYKESESFELKIGSRYCSYYDYGEHLLRMMKRAVTWEELQETKRCYGCVFEGITLVENGKETRITPKEWEDIVYDFIYGKRSGKYTRHYSYYYDEAEIINAMEKNNAISFYIG